MIYTAAEKKKKLRGMYDTGSSHDSNLNISIIPVSDEEADEIEFKSLKGIAGRSLDLDEIRKERLGI